MAIRPKKQRSSSSPGKYLSETQLKKLLRYVGNKADLARRNGATRAIIDEVIILLLVNTGLRPRELCNLNIEDLPLRRSQNALLVRDSRGDITREIDINSKIAKSLQMFVRLYRKGANPDDPLIINERGNRFRYMSLYSKVKNIGRKAKIGKLYPHMLRRTYMIRLYNAERYLRLVQEQAGHANQKTTAIYVKKKHKHKQKNPKIEDTDSKTVKSIDLTQRESKIITCEGCGREIFEYQATKIDSGQNLCSDCLKYVRYDNFQEK